MNPILRRVARKRPNGTTANSGVNQRQGRETAHGPPPTSKQLHAIEAARTRISAMGAHVAGEPGGWSLVLFSLP
jgi:hypothetical protein